MSKKPDSMAHFPKELLLQYSSPNKAPIYLISMMKDPRTGHPFRAFLSKVSNFEEQWTFELDDQNDSFYSVDFKEFVDLDIMGVVTEIKGEFITIQNLAASTLELDFSPKMIWSFEALRDPRTNIFIQEKIVYPAKRTEREKYASNARFLEAEAKMFAAKGKKATSSKNVDYDGSDREHKEYEAPKRGKSHGGGTTQRR